MEKHFRKNIPAMLLAVFVMAFLLAGPVLAANWQQKYERFSATAGETLATGNVVCISGSDGKAYKADADDAAKRPAVGVIGKGGASGAKVEIITRGMIAGMAAATAGGRLYLSTTAGALMNTAPTNAQALGFVVPPDPAATAGTVYFIKVQIPTSLGAGY